MSAPPLVLLCGPTHAGKSTLAAALTARLGFEVVSLDDLNARRGLYGGDGVAEAEWARTLREAHDEVARRLARPGSRVLVDDTACWRWLRDGWRELAARCGRETRLVVLRVDEAEVRRRIAARARRGVAPEVLEPHLASFEWPGADEPHHVARGVDDVAAWLSDAPPR